MVKVLQVVFLAFSLSARSVLGAVSPGEDVSTCEACVAASRAWQGKCLKDTTCIRSDVGCFHTERQCADADKPLDKQGSCFCAQIYAPVCGKNGVPYYNSCKAKCDQQSDYTEGKCKVGLGKSCGGEMEVPCKEYLECVLDGGIDGTCQLKSLCGSCTEDFKPVCGTNTISYQNECKAKCDGAVIASEGRCLSQEGQICGGFINAQCAAGLECDFFPGGSAGICKPEPEGCFCIELFDPVCGADGVTYSNGCKAACAGVTVVSQGNCPLQPSGVGGTCGGFTGAQCEAGLSCVLFEGSTAGTCQDTCDCPSMYNPVCGSDRVTYASRCKAKCVGAVPAPKGSCQSLGEKCGADMNQCSKEFQCQLGMNRVRTCQRPDGYAPKTCTDAAGNEHKKHDTWKQQNGCTECSCDDPVGAPEGTCSTVDCPVSTSCPAGEVPTKVAGVCCLQCKPRACAPQDVWECYFDPCKYSNCLVEGATCATNNCEGCAAEWTKDGKVLTQAECSVKQVCVTSDGSEYKKGAVWKPNDCTECECNDPIGRPQGICKSESCAAPTCDNPVKVEGQCCPECYDCSTTDTWTNEKAAWCCTNEDKCNQKCARVRCSNPQCGAGEQLTRPFGACCSICHKPCDGEIVNCFASPCDGASCPKLQNAVCTDNYCNGCSADWSLYGIPFDSSSCGDQYNCYTEEVWSTPKSDWCCANRNLGCKDKTFNCMTKEVWTEEKVAWCCKFEGRGCGTAPCDEGFVQCLIAPCDVSTCPAVPHATCTDNYCGGCNAIWTTNGGQSLSAKQCNPGAVTPKFDCLTKELWSKAKASWCCQKEGRGCGDTRSCTDGFVQCFVAPCDVSSCASIPGAKCEDNYCGGCNAIWSLNGAVFSRDSCESIEPEPYDCSSNQASWSADHSVWCCANRGQGCNRVCKGAGTYFGIGQQWNEDACTSCVCENPATNPGGVCMSQSCAQCADDEVPVFANGVCCPDCQPNSILQNNNGGGGAGAGQSCNSNCKSGACKDNGQTCTDCDSTKVLAMGKYNYNYWGKCYSKFSCQGNKIKNGNDKGYPCTCESSACASCIRTAYGEECTRCKNGYFTLDNECVESCPATHTTHMRSCVAPFTCTGNKVVGAVGKARCKCQTPDKKPDRFCKSCEFEAGGYGQKCNKCKAKKFLDPKSNNCRDNCDGLYGLIEYISGSQYSCRKPFTCDKRKDDMGGKCRCPKSTGGISCVTCDMTAYGTFCTKCGKNKYLKNGACVNNCGSMTAQGYDVEGRTCV